jgi:hypothetical protein
LLAQPNFKSDKGTTFDEMREIKEIVQPHGRFVNLGFFILRKSRRSEKPRQTLAVRSIESLFRCARQRRMFLRFCGNPSLLWQTLRYTAENYPMKISERLKSFQKKAT